jgi:hypothetical protein
MYIKRLIQLLLFITPFSLAAQDTPSLEQMWQIIQQQQATIEKLQDQIQGNSQVVEQQSQTIEIISDNIDESTNLSQSKYKFGGYGEVHYGNTDKGNSIDAHRFVLFNGYDFTDNTRFYSELEVEHALSGDGLPGEVELEQAFIEHRVNDKTTITAGVSLLPVGIINQTHEPTTFYGVERNNVEKNIIPTTWWAAGLGLSQRLNETFAYDIFISEGLNVALEGSDAFLIRKGRQGTAKAKANSGAITSRLRFSPNNHLQINASMMYQQDITQGALGVDATLFETNVHYNINNFSLKALYARWDLDKKVKAIAAGREQQSGFYLEPSYRFGSNNQYGVFSRYSQWDNNAGDDNNTDITQFDFGFNYWLTPQVVFKADYQDQSGTKDDDGFHLGMGYSF